MWLINHNAILTKDNLTKRNWSGDSSCAFCNEAETIPHLFFDCTMAKYIWSLVVYVLGAGCRPTSFGQFWIWIQNVMKEKKKFHMVGLSAICWAIWLARNKFPFEGKLTQSPTEIICSASSFISYWAGLQKESDKECLETGAEILKMAALHFHQQRQDNSCLMLPC